MSANYFRQPNPLPGLRLWTPLEGFRRPQTFLAIGPSPNENSLRRHWSNGQSGRISDVMHFVHRNGAYSVGPDGSRRGRVAVCVHSECRSCLVASCVWHSSHSDSSWTQTSVHHTRWSARRVVQGPVLGVHRLAAPADHCRHPTASQVLAPLDCRPGSCRQSPTSSRRVWSTSATG